MHSTNKAEIVLQSTAVLRHCCSENTLTYEIILYLQNVSEAAVKMLTLGKAIFYLIYTFNTVSQFMYYSMILCGVELFRRFKHLNQ